MNRRSQRIRHALVPPALLALLAAATTTAIAASGGPSAAAAASGAAPAALITTGTFIDTFAESGDTDPGYGLNVSLGSRQIGTARATYTRVSGAPGDAPPPAPWYVQVNHPVHPNRLSFWCGTSAVMLDAPVRAGTDGTYTIRTTIDPVLGDTASTDWGSLVLSRSRMSAGHATAADVDLGLTVGSDGGLVLYHAGQRFWQGSVPVSGTGYDTSLTVSSNADRAVRLVVNGTTFAVTGPDGLGRWPSTPYLYLGAQQSTGDEITTFGTGAPGEGLSVSQVDTSIAASSRLFVDTFDGSPDTDATGYGLNAGLRSRQPTVVANGYTRIPGTDPSATVPPTWASQANHPSYPDRMSFWTRPSAVRLDKPLAADLAGGYAVRAVVDPAENTTTTGTAWAALMLSASAGSTGDPTAADTDLGVTVTDDGRVQAYRRGRPAWKVPPTVAPASNGSFDVTVTVPDTAVGTVSILVNGAQLNPAGSGVLPSLAYLMLGSNVSGQRVATVDDLRMSKLGGLNFYGYYDVQDPTDHADHSSEVAGFTNFNLYLDPPPAARLDYCRPQSCLINIQWQQFEQGADRMVLRANSLENVRAFRADVGDLIGKVGAIYLVDEPYGLWSTRNVTEADLQAATDQVASVFAGKPLVLTLDGGGVSGTDPRAIPRNIDMVGFDQYCTTGSALRSSVATLQSRLTAYQQMFLVPEAANRSWCAGGSWTDARVAEAQNAYAAVAAANPRVVYLMNFGWWLGTYTENGQRAGEPDPFGALPLTSAAQRALGASVIKIN